MNSSNSISAYTVATELVSALPKRSREVIMGRFGLKDGRKKTLEAIGNGFGITRERVRQIEADGLAMLRKPESLARLAEHFEIVKRHFAEHGGLRREERLLAELAERFGQNTPQERAAVTLVLTLAGSFEREREDDGFYTMWYASPEAVAKARKALELLSQSFAQDRRTIPDAELEGRAANVAATLGGTPTAVFAYVDASKDIEANPFGEWGLARWAEVKPRGVKDKAYLVFKRAAKPLHFREVAEHINATVAKKRPAHPQTVHNELIKDARFVLVGRGTYALAEWGYQPGTVREVLLKVLKENGRPMTKDELLSEVMKRRFVKENTILLNLQHRSFFVRTPEGRYALKSA